VPKAIYWTPPQPAFQSTPEDLSLPRSAELRRLDAERPAPTPEPLSQSGSFDKDASTEGDDRGSAAATRSALRVTQARPSINNKSEHQQRRPETPAPSPSTTESASESLASPLPPLTPPPLPPLSPIQPRAATDCGASKSSDDGSGRGGSGGGAPVPLRQVLGPLDNRAGGLLHSSPPLGGEAVSRQHHNAKERMRR